MKQSAVLYRFLILVTLLGALGLATAAPALAATQQSGDSICTGNNLTIAAGQTVNNVLAFGCNVTVEADGQVNGSISSFGGNVLVRGTVDESVLTFGGNVAVEATGVVNGDLVTVGGSVSTAPGARVHGNVGPNGVPPRVIPPVFFGANRIRNFGFDLIGSLVTALAFAALGALIVIFAPEPTRRVGNAVMASPWNTAGVGCLTLILLPVLCILLTITIIGIPVALILGFLLAVAWIFGWIAIGYLAGEKILAALRAQNILPVVAVVLGVLLLALVSQVPVLGWLISLVVGLLGIGAVVMTRFGTRVYPAPPGMTMMPVAAAPGAPNVFTPARVDMAAWEAKAREAEAKSAASPSPASDEPAASGPASSPPAGEAPKQEPPTAATSGSEDQPQPEK